MLYFSEILNKTFKTPEELNAAEREDALTKEAERKAAETKAAERKARADAVSKARDETLAAQKRYSKLLDEFIKDYGSFHATYTKTGDLDDLFSVLLSWL